MRAREDITVSDRSHGDKLEVDRVDVLLIPIEELYFLVFNPRRTHAMVEIGFGDVEESACAEVRDEKDEEEEFNDLGECRKSVRDFQVLIALLPATIRLDEAVQRNQEDNHD